MWKTVEIIVHFIGYASSFWLIWKILDHLFHKVKKKSPELECPHCFDNRIRVNRLEVEFREATKMNVAVEEAIALGQLNVATQAEIEKIYGIGHVKAAKIVEQRPFRTWQDFRKIEPSYKNNIVRWAKNRLTMQPSRKWLCSPIKDIH